MRTIGTHIHITLLLANLKDEAREVLVARITAHAPNSAVATRNPKIGDMAVKLGTDQGTYRMLAARAAATAQLLKVHEDERDSAKAEGTRDLNVLRTLVECEARTDAEVTETGFAAQELGPRDPLAAPTGIKIREIKRSNGALLTAKQAGTVRPCAAEITTTPADLGSYKTLPGAGATRKLVGYEPGLYWVRFATLLGHEQSAWCEPVPVSIKGK